MRFIRYLAAGTLVGAMAGCADFGLDVENINNPDRTQVLGSPSTVEALAGAQFQQIVAGTLGQGTPAATGLQRPHPSMLTMAFENATGLANQGMGPRSFFPRQPIDNNRGNAYATENFSTYRMLSGSARNASLIDERVKAAGFVLGTGAAAEGNLNRLRAWNHFISGVSHGYLSLTYDSAAILTPGLGVFEVPPLQSYQAINAYALAQFDSALVYLARPGTTALPEGWLTGPGGATVSTARFTQVVRSFKARMRAGVARTPEERAAVDWDQVIADATAGLDSDLMTRFSPEGGWDYHWMNNIYHFRDVSWHQMPYHIIGMADVSGGFESWLSQGRDTREPFLIITPDLRFPQGTTRTAQNEDRGGQGAPTGRKYFRNRSAGLDAAGVGWGQSQYDHYRFRSFAAAGRIGDFPIFTQAENDMLAAEGHIRRNNISAAAALIDRTRTTAGLPALAGVVTSATQPVPGGAQCVPRIPVAPTFTTTACGNIMEAMKWEKRLEMAYTAFGGWYFDSRGWGDLPEGTAIHWPVPFQELDAREQPLYSLGGVGRPGSAGPSNYGYGTGAR